MHKIKKTFSAIGLPIAIFIRPKHPNTTISLCFIFSCCVSKSFSLLIIAQRQRNLKGFIVENVQIHYTSNVLVFQQARKNSKKQEGLTMSREEKEVKAVAQSESTDDTMAEEDKKKGGYSMSRKKKAISERLLPVIADGTENKIQVLDAAIKRIYFGRSKNIGIADNPAIDVVELRFMRLFRVDDQFNENEEVILADNDFFYFDYEIEIKPSEGSLYSQLLTAAFHGKEMPTSDFNLSLLESSWVKLVIEDGRFLTEICPLTDTSAIDKDPTVNAVSM